jgi:hypothetical protein
MWRKGWGLRVRMAGFCFGGDPIFGPSLFFGGSDRDKLLNFIIIDPGNRFILSLTTVF